MSIRHQVSLQSYNTFGIATQAAHFASFTNVEELQGLLAHAKEKNWPILVLGGGSNLLFTKPVAGLTLHNQIDGINILREDDQYVWVAAGAGVLWHTFVVWTIENNLAGLENLSLIPGYVGAAPLQNIGAYGVEIKDSFDHLEAVAIATGDLATFTNADCQFGYRESIFKHALRGQYVITRVVFKLQKPPHNLHTSYGAIQATLNEAGIVSPTIKDISNAVIKIRSGKLPDPAKLGNAGSFFKNPTITTTAFEPLQAGYPDIPHYPLPDDMVKLPAAWLIEQCGWKGKQLGPVGAHATQPLVLVNYGGASGLDVLELAKRIQASVQEKFSIHLEPEVNIL